MEETDFREYKRMKKLIKRTSTEDANRKATSVKCRYCGHTNSIPAFKNYKICHWCNHKVINDTKVHFIRKMKELLKKEE